MHHQSNRNSCLLLGLRHENGHSPVYVSLSIFYEESKGTRQTDLISELQSYRGFATAGIPATPTNHLMRPGGRLVLPKAITLLRASVMSYSRRGSDCFGRLVSVMEKPYLSSQVKELRNAQTSNFAGRVFKGGVLKKTTRAVKRRSYFLLVWLRVCACNLTTGHMSGNEFFAFDLVNAQDAQQNWREAFVLDVDKAVQRVKIHFVSLPASSGEW